MVMTIDGAGPRYRLRRILLPGRAQHSSGGAEITRARRVDRTGLTPLLPAAIAVFVAMVSVADVRAQFLPAGAWDDPRENIQDVWWRHENRLEVGIGPSLIARQWRAAAHRSYDGVLAGILARFSGSIRAGMYGAYEPDVDEWADRAALV